MFELHGKRLSLIYECIGGVGKAGTTKRMDIDRKTGRYLSWHFICVMLRFLSPDTTCIHEM